jgi:Flp pilus assembly protein protease CpaA
MGAGDAKLWMAMLWALPADSPATVLPLMFLTFFISGLLQNLWRLAAKGSPIHQLTPGAWRTIPFFMMWWYAH